jgi:hypothetical protein
MCNPKNKTNTEKKTKQTKKKPKKNNNNKKQNKENFKVKNEMTVAQTLPNPRDAAWRGGW